MPFVIAHGIPGDTEKRKLQALRRSMVDSLSKTMSCSRRSVSVYLPVDLLGFTEEEDRDEANGAQMIYVRIDTALYDGKEDEQAMKLVTDDLATVVFAAFCMRFTVEVFIHGLRFSTKTLIEAER
jgi:hypothetical protein